MCRGSHCKTCIFLLVVSAYAFVRVCILKEDSSDNLLLLQGSRRQTLRQLCLRCRYWRVCFTLLIWKQVWPTHFIRVGADISHHSNCSDGCLLGSQLHLRRAQRSHPGCAEFWSGTAPGGAFGQCYYHSPNSGPAHCGTAHSVNIHSLIEMYFKWFSIFY